MSDGLILRRTGTFVKVRDVEKAMIVRASDGRGMGGKADKIVARCERAADIVETTRIAIGKTSSRGLLAPLADLLVLALETLDVYGREARLILFAGESRFRAYTSQEELRYARRATTAELEEFGL